LFALHRHGHATGTLLFNFEDVKQEIVQLEKYGVSKKVGNHHGQEARHKCGFNSSRNKWTFGSGPAGIVTVTEDKEEARRNGVEMEKKEMSGNCDVYVKPVC